MKLVWTIEQNVLRGSGDVTVHIPIDPVDGIDDARNIRTLIDRMLRGTHPEYTENLKLFDDDGKEINF